MTTKASTVNAPFLPLRGWAHIAPTAALISLPKLHEILFLERVIYTPAREEDSLSLHSYFPELPEDEAVI